MKIIPVIHYKTAPYALFYNVNNLLTFFLLITKSQKLFI